MKLFGSRSPLEDRRIAAHVAADVRAGIFNIDAFVAAFLPRKSASAYDLQLAVNALAANASEYTELKGDRRTRERSNPTPRFEALRARAICGVFGLLEVITLARVFLSLGNTPQDAYATAIVVAAIAVGFIEGAVRAYNRAVRAWCYVGLTIMLLSLAYVRAGAFVEGDTPIATGVAGVIALVGAAGAGVGLHHYRARATRASKTERQVKTMDREIEERSQELAAAQTTATRDAREAKEIIERGGELRAMYPRLHAIEFAKQHPPTEELNGQPT